MFIEKNRVVSFTFELRLENASGERIKKVEKTRPLKIVYGRGNLLEPFETRLAGLKAGDKFGFELKSSDTYGPYNEKAVTELDKTIFTNDSIIDDEILRVGNYLPMETETGIPFTGKILEISGDKVKIDFNHPLAGQELYFQGEILEVREATQSEIET